MNECNDLDQRVTSMLETKYLTETRNSIYIALEDLDFIWDEKEVYKVERLWNEGKGIWAIAEMINRDPDEIAVLIMDRARKDRLRDQEENVS